VDDRTLEHLLKQADQAAPPADMPAGIASAALEIVHRQRRSRRRLMIVSAASVCIFAFTTGLWKFQPRSPTTVVTNFPNNNIVDDQNRKLAELDAEIERQSRLIDRLEKAERRVERRSQKARRGLWVWSAPIDASVEEAAFAVVFQADRMAARGLTKSAVEFYRLASERFPDTPAAQRALLKLRQLDSDERSS
jgi:hypothetical protein